MPELVELFRGTMRSAGSVALYGASGIAVIYLLTLIKSLFSNSR